MAPSQLLRFSNAHAQIAEGAIVEAVNQAVYGELLMGLPGIPDDRRTANVDHLFNDVQFAGPITTCAQIFHGREMILMPGLHVLDMPQPVLNQS